MGQLAARFIQWCEKMKTPEKFKDGELNKLVMEQDSVSKTKAPERKGVNENELNNGGADLKPVTAMDHREETEKEDEQCEEAEDSEAADKALGDVDLLNKRQEQLLDEHKVRIEGLEDSLHKVSHQMEQKDKELKAAENQEMTKEKEADEQWVLLQENSRILEEHEQQLNSQSIEIKMLAKVLDDKQGARKHTEDAEEKQSSPTQNYEQIKKEVKFQLEQQQRLLDNLFAGFLVAFIIVVVICMLPKSDFSVPKQSFLDNFWAVLSGHGLPPK